MKRLNNYFFGQDSISFLDGIWFYGLGISTVAISIFVLAILHLNL